MSHIGHPTPVNKKAEYQKVVQQYKLNLLLANVKKAVELCFLTSVRTGGTASICLDQVANTCVEVLKHGLHLETLNNVEKRKALCKLKNDFSWLNRSSQIRDCQATSIETSTLENFLHHWTLQNLKSNCLCAAIQALLVERDLIEFYYPQTSAFLRQECYSTGLLICLSAVELNQYSLLSQVDPKLCDARRGMPNSRAQHRRTTSHPNFSLSPPKSTTLSLHRSATVTDATKPATTVLFRRVKSLPQLSESFVDTTRKRSQTVVAVSHKESVDKNVDTLCKTTKTPAINKENSVSNSTLNSKEDSYCPSLLSENASVASTNSSYTTARRIKLINCDDIKIWTDHDWEMEQKHKKMPIEVIAPSALPQDIPQTKSVSPITSFLSNIFGTPPGYTAWAMHQTSAMADTTMSAEDATQDLNSSVDNTSALDSTLKIGNVFDSFIPTYGSKLRPQHDLFETGISYLDYSQPSTSKNAQKSIEPISTPPKNCETLIAFLQMSKLSRTNTELDKENAHFRVSEAIIAAVEHIKWSQIQAGEKISVKKQEQEEHIAYAEVSGVEEFADQHSAEELGIALLSKFHGRTKGNELKWLVADEDTPQELLPLPENVTNDPDEHFVPSLTRGTQYWAPPRPQIIFTDHATPNRKEMVRKQNNRCAGCGMVVSAQHVNSFRYCMYLGKYHCTGCHRNQMSAIPAKILRFWDFKYYPVSSFAYRLLEQMYAFPLFNVADLHPELYQRQIKLRTARNKRRQLKFLRDFVISCRFALAEQKYFQAVPEYLTAEPDLWSMNDFFDVKHKSMQRSIDDLIECCENHIFNCVLCSARGFLCEFCHKDSIIYPWQKNVYRCDYCGTCYHHKCCKLPEMSVVCLRCQRMNKRQENVADTVETLNDN